jgi:hypothetical protein
MRQLSNKEMPLPEDKNSVAYAFGESNKNKTTSALLVIIVGKINNKQELNALKEISTYLRDSAAKDSKCRSHLSELVEIRLAGGNVIFHDHSAT